MCGATRPPLLGQDKGWECDGTGLVAVKLDGEPLVALGVPVVIRADMLDAARVSDGIAYGSLPFAGGDHLHLTVKPS